MFEEEPKPVQNDEQGKMPDSDMPNPGAPDSGTDEAFAPGEAAASTVNQGNGADYKRSNYDKTAAQPEQPPVEYKENVFMGVLGAIIFAIPGGALAFVLSLFGYVASLSGLAAAALAMLGYKVFSGANKNKHKKPTTASIVVSVVVTLLILLIAEYMTYSFVMSKNFGISIFEGMAVMPALLAEAELRKYFITDVLGIWVFAALGMGAYIYSLVKKAEK